MTRAFHSKVVLCGDLAVGKTSVRRNFMGLSFVREHVSTLGADFSLKKVDVGEDDRMDLQIWDLGGQEGYEKLRRRYFSGSRGALMIFDLTNKESFENLTYWFEEMWSCTPANEIPVVILGNKCDLDDFEVDDAEVRKYIKDLTKKHNLTDVKYEYFRTSAKDGTNIDDAFQGLAEAIHVRLIKELGLNM